MVTMFLDKTVKSANDNLPKYQQELKEAPLGKKEILERQIKQNQKTIEKSGEFKLKIAINEGRILDSIKLFC